MKKYYNNIRTIAILLLAGVTITACNDKDNYVEETEQHAYSLTISATKGVSPQTRALDESGITLKSTWAATDQVVVLNSSGTKIGTLTATASTNSSTTLTGTLTSAPTAGDNLTLLFPRETVDYTGQIGTLEDIAEKYDYATAPVTVATVDGYKITTTADASFTNQQAIVKFVLKDETDTPINPDILRISATGLKTSDTTEGDIVITPTSSTNEIYVALSGISSTTVTITTTAGSKTYFYQKTGVTFTNGKYYIVNMKMQEKTIYYFGAVRYGDQEMTMTKNPADVGSVSEQGTVTINSTSFCTFTTDGSCPVDYTTGFDLPSYWESRGWELDYQWIFLIIPQKFYLNTGNENSNAGFFLDIINKKKYRIKAGNMEMPISVSAEEIYSTTIDGVPYYVTLLSNNGVTIGHWNFSYLGTYE